MQSGLLDAFHRLIDKLMGNEAEHSAEMKRLESTIHQHDVAMAASHDAPDLIDRVTDCASSEQSARKWLHPNVDEFPGEAEQQS